ncbi:MAG: MBG domain-containing protein [Lachnospiraceae bacterium]|nr:MBG domain-containing protein [Lachnospiraceae bacterium]
MRKMNRRISSLTLAFIMVVSLLWAVPIKVISAPTQPPIYITVEGEDVKTYNYNSEQKYYYLGENSIVKIKVTASGYYIKAHKDTSYATEISIKANEISTRFGSDISQIGAGTIEYACPSDPDNFDPDNPSLSGAEYGQITVSSLYPNTENPDIKSIMRCDKTASTVTFSMKDEDNNEINTNTDNIVRVHTVTVEVSAGGNRFVYSTESSGNKKCDITAENATSNTQNSLNWTRWKQTIVFDANPDNSEKACSITVTDFFGNEEKCEFTLKYKRLRTIKNFDVQSSYNVGETFSISAEAEPSATVTLEYRENKDGTSFTTTQPTEAGDYIVRASVAEDANYEYAHEEREFSIVKNTQSVTSLSCADIEVEGTPNPVFTTNPDSVHSSVKIEYKKQSEGSDQYSEIVPTAAGEYNVRVTLPETSYYSPDSTGMETGFEIKKITPNTAMVTIADIDYGEEPSPSISTDSDGGANVTYKYKKDGESEYTTPENAGKYWVEAIIPETDKYNSITSTPVAFNINKLSVSGTVSVSNTVVGTDYQPVVDTVAEGKSAAVFYYKPSGAADDAYTTEKPIKAGTYYVKATVPSTDNYEQVNCPAVSYTISRKTPQTAKVNVPDIKVGEEVTPTVTTDSDGTPSYMYKKYDADDSTYDSTVPTAAGKYTVIATIPKTAKYGKITCSTSFTISRLKPQTALVKVADITIGDDITPVITTDSDGKDKTVFEYKVEGQSDSSYSKTEPKNAGAYTVRATVPKTDKYEKVTCEATFSIKKKTATATVKLSDQYVGVKYEPVLTTASDGKYKATFRYRKAGEDESAFTSAKPTEAGAYVLKVDVPETDKYNAVSVEKEFEIKYLSDTKASYSISGEKGKNGYYVSDVYLKAPKGYEISTSRDGKYSDEILYDENITTVYLRRASDGAWLEPAKISSKIDIDKDYPTITSAYTDSGKNIYVSDGNTIYADKLTIQFNDDNLTEVKIIVDSEVQELEAVDGKALLSLESYDDTKKFSLTAEDKAGHEHTISFVLSAAWMETNIVPSGRKLPLKTGRMYGLDSGTWTVSGDATVYKGNREFFVTSIGDYTFTTK